MTTAWAPSILVPLLLLGGDGTGRFAEKKANEPPATTKALVIEGTDGIRVRIEQPDAGPKTMTIRGIAGGRVRMEWDDKLAIESRSFVMRRPVDERTGKSDKTTMESTGEGSVTFTVDEQGDNSGRNRTTIQCVSASLQFKSLTASVPR
jgi:hypothetical protein